MQSTPASGKLPLGIIALVGLLLITSGLFFYKVLTHTRPAKHASFGDDQDGDLLGLSESPRDPPPSPDRARLHVPERQRPVPQFAVSPELPGAPIDPATQQTRRRQEVDDVLGRLRSSGPATASWTSKAAAVFQGWKDSAATSGAVTFTDFRCFAAGCAMKATYPNTDAFVDSSRDFQESASFKSWSGPKFRSGPMDLASGQVEALWVLYKI